MTFTHLAEADVERLLTAELALQAARDAFLSVASGVAENFPVIREVIAEGSVYGVKSGHHRALGALGLKSAGSWAANKAIGLAAHQASVLLVHPDTGLARALVSANRLTAARTAAAAALSIQVLARPDAGTLALIGVGAQAPAMLELARLMRPFKRILIGLRRPSSSLTLPDGMTAEAVHVQEAVRNADVLITLTPSREPIVAAGLVKPGCHIAAMGSDTRGKREIAPEVLAASRLFGDVISQNLSIGEGQGMAASAYAGTLGAVLAGDIAGRTTEEEITIFDSTGFAVQDLVLAEALLRKADL